MADYKESQLFFATVKDIAKCLRMLPPNSFSMRSDMPLEILDAFLNPLR